MSVVDLRPSGGPSGRPSDDLDALSEVELIDLYLRIRARLAARLASDGGSESLEMLFARMADVVEPPPQPPVARTKVSPREREVLHFLAQERTNAQIASSLFISENTVKNHVRNILGKYEVGTRHGAVMAAIREGTLTVD